MKLCSKGSRHPSNLLTAPEEGSHLPNFDFSFANVTSWNESVQQFFLDSGMRCFLIQEHRLLRPAFQRLSVFFRSKGFHLTGVPARATEQGGASGGVVIAMHHSIQSRPGPQVKKRTFLDSGMGKAGEGPACGCVHLLEGWGRRVW